jgi:hypothetical protein
MFRGIFHHLSEEGQGNPHLTGKVTVSAIDEQSGCKLKVYDLISTGDKTGKWWGTNTTAIDHYIKFEFQSCRICPSGYSLKAHNQSWGKGYWIRSWRFEASNDDSEWTILDTQENSDAIAANDKAAYFATSGGQAYRFLRIIMTGVNSSNTRQLSLQQIEFFGQIHEYKSL